MSGPCVNGLEVYCDGRCRSRELIRFCDGRLDCLDGTDEILCQANKGGYSDTYTVPSSDIVTTIVLPTIVACILLVAAMLLGINKCKQWEFDKIMEMRRTRRVVQRMTARLREKNFRTIQRARSLRKRAQMVQGGGNGRRSSEAPPPVYERGSGPPFASGTSPPPAYEDTLLDFYYQQCVPSPERATSHRSSTSSRRTLF